jgi:hypothetical protein
LVDDGMSFANDCHDLIPRTLFGLVSGCVHVCLHAKGGFCLPMVVPAECIVYLSPLALMTF